MPKDGKSPPFEILRHNFSQGDYSIPEMIRDARWEVGRAAVTRYFYGYEVKPSRQQGNETVERPWLFEYFITHG